MSFDSNASEEKKQHGLVKSTICILFYTHFTLYHAKLVLMKVSCYIYWIYMKSKLACNSICFYKDDDDLLSRKTSSHIPQLCYLRLSKIQWHDKSGLCKWCCNVLHKSCSIFYHLEVCNEGTTVLMW